MQALRLPPPGSPAPRWRWALPPRRCSASPARPWPWARASWALLQRRCMWATSLSPFAIIIHSTSKTPFTYMTTNHLQSIAACSDADDSSMQAMLLLVQRVKYNRYLLFASALGSAVDLFKEQRPLHSSAVPHCKRYGDRISPGSRYADLRSRRGRHDSPSWSRCLGRCCSLGCRLLCRRPCLHMH